MTGRGELPRLEPLGETKRGVPRLRAPPPHVAPPGNACPTLAPGVGGWVIRDDPPAAPGPLKV